MHFKLHIWNSSKLDIYKSTENTHKEWNKLLWQHLSQTIFCFFRFDTVPIFHNLKSVQFFSRIDLEVYFFSITVTTILVVTCYDVHENNMRLNGLMLWEWYGRTGVWSMCEHMAISFAQGVRSHCSILCQKMASMSDGHGRCQACPMCGNWWSVLFLF